MVMFSKNLKYYRLRNHLSKKDLADKAGVTAMAITNYEKVNEIQVWIFSRL
jgi:transcriptional regulator with XRE-family HTH domain